MYPEAVRAVELLFERGEELYVVPQNLIEFWAVATRPIERNGLGMTAEQADAEIATLRRRVPLLRDIPPIFEEWHRLVTMNAVVGVRVHDVHLVAAMIVHGLTRILTFNAADFRRYGEITVVSPADVIQESA